jgi:hypothetical protein
VLRETGAVALEALFADTLGGDTALILDEEATHARIEAELNELQLFRARFGKS